MSDRRLETKGRARALQLLYAWDVTGGEPIDRVAWGVGRLIRPQPRVLDLAEVRAQRVIANLATLDRHATAAMDNWRWERVGAIERNILRLAIQELLDDETPPKVVLDEAIRLAQRFGGPRTPAFVNGLLDRVARNLGRLGQPA
jgi:N utilization substance protein B